MTPTQDLLLEVLAARTRLGETLWTFDSRHRRALEELEQQGLVEVMNGIVEKTVRASLTERGRKQQLSENYTPPLYRQILTMHPKEQAKLLGGSLEYGWGNAGPHPSVRAVGPWRIA